MEFAPYSSSAEVLELLLDRWPVADTEAQEQGWDSLLAAAVSSGDRYDDDGTKAMSSEVSVWSVSYDGTAEGL